MRKDVLIMLAGISVALIPFLGFPNTWDTVFFVTLGACTIGLGIAVRRGDRLRRQTSLFEMRNQGDSSLERHEV
ncbi:hypothetical protein HY413_02250 [Candidatus Kaiserbacteria bacterium]|nr:hypothetical protein [Candidatus Kaiserbacteria bacterium]